MSKKHFFRKKIREYWNSFFSSAYNKMSRGAQNIFKTISWARGENWRRTQKRSEKKFQNKKK